MEIDIQKADKAIGQYLRASRDTKEFTVRQVGEMVGISYSEVSRLENAIHGNIRIELLLKFAHALDIDLGEMFRQLNLI
ncbi:hypothetical protein CSV69_09505 [Sporosarcina sp. P26b]|uniref:helix-turn-helix domain-containing protein n=1 Tax=Sporosarcina sp. P26b TaxID=2048253 RepID=UPI000C16D3A9|nr:helix-turn-helix transcriptional regulator [Sporosarcina sp. P26b]PIC95752.1 hypothetical protein CSV69_09505 [Sporosarcina sp. P26b]